MQLFDLMYKKLNVKPRFPWEGYSILVLDKEKTKLKEKIDKILKSYEFLPINIKRKNREGKVSHEIAGYNCGEVYLYIDFFKNDYNSDNHDFNKMPEWVTVMSAVTLSDAEYCCFDPGESISLSLSVNEILSKLKQQIIELKKI